ncbi:hypothetical protein ACLKA6_004076 [Drosophila palustris]
MGFLIALANKLGQNGSCYQQLRLIGSISSLLCSARLVLISPWTRGGSLVLNGEGEGEGVAHQYRLLPKRNNDDDDDDDERCHRSWHLVGLQSPVDSPLSSTSAIPCSNATLIYCYQQQMRRRGKRGGEGEGETAIVQKVPIKHILCSVFALALASARKVLNKATQDEAG